MIQSVLLAAFGFLSAVLIALVMAPALWRRAVRLTSKRIRSSLPLTEMEIRADKDLLRAEYAVRVHRLEREIERYKLNAHRQLIEINRRDTSIRRYDEEVARLKADLEEHENARRVLEQTINDRLPRVEARLEEARRLLQARDQHIAELSNAAAVQQEYFEEARSINAQQAAEIERLKLALTTAPGRDRRRHAEPGADMELVLRSEAEALRAKTREQSSLIERLQREIALLKADPATSLQAASRALAGGAGDEVLALRGRLASQTAELEQLRKDLARTELERPRDAAGTATHHASLEAKIREQEQTIAQLQQELALLNEGEDADKRVAIRETKALLKTRLERVQGELARERQVVERLRADLVAANERAARQAAFMREEMRRLGRSVPIATVKAAPEAAEPQTGRGDRAAAPDAQPAVRRIASKQPTTERARRLQRSLIDRMRGHAGVPESAVNPAGNGAAVAEPAQATASPAVAAPAADFTAAEQGASRETTPAPTVAHTSVPDEATAEIAEAAGNGGRRRLLDRLRRYEDG